MKTPNLESRVARVEEAVEGISRSLGHISGAIDQLRAEQAKGKERPWATIVSAIGVASVIVGAIGYGFITPVKVIQDMMLQYGEKRLMASEGALEATRLRIRDLEHGVNTTAAQLEERLKEVETQFRWETNEATIINAYNTRVDGILWNEIFGSPLPLLYSPKIGPDGAK